VTSSATPGGTLPWVILAAATVLVILACGAIATLAALPAGHTSIPARLAAVFGLGYAMVLWPATALALVHLLRPWSLALLLATVSCSLLAWTLRRTPPRVLLAGLRDEARRGWPVVVFGLLALTAIAIARLSIPVDASAGGWRYWSDGLEFADAGAVPSTVLQWGALHAPAISKLGANSFNAGLSFVLRDHPFSAMAAALWISAVGFAAGMFALGWELGLRWCAAALPLLALTDHAWPGGLVLDADIVHKLAFFQTEDSGRMCMLAALVLAVPLLRGDAGDALPRAIATAALIGAAALTHLVAVIGIAPLMAGYALAASVRSGRWRAIARWSVAAAAGGIAVAAMALLLAGGDLGFQGASGTPYRAVNGRYDPTAALLGLRKTPIPKSHRRFYTPPVTAARTLYSTATALPASGRTLALPLLALGLLGLAAVLLGGRPERLAVAAALFALASLYAVELLFSARYAYYVPATFGDRRVFEYASLPLLVLGAAGVNALFGRTRQLRTALPAVCAAALPVLIVAGIGWDGLTAGVHGGPATSSMIEAARVATPCNARLLTPSSTRGSFQALTGRASMQEGLMVFLRPSLLAQALDIESRARQFYADPAANTDLLRRWSIDYVLARPHQARRLTRLPELSLRAQVGPVSVFAAEGAGADAPRPDDVPGYRCTREPLR
jgi:hypothetical protein